MFVINTDDNYSEVAGLQVIAAGVSIVIQQFHHTNSRLQLAG